MLGAKAWNLAGRCKNPALTFLIVNTLSLNVLGRHMLSMCRVHSVTSQPQGLISTESRSCSSSASPGGIQALGKGAVKDAEMWRKVGREEIKLQGRGTSGEWSGEEDLNVKGERGGNKMEAVWRKKLYAKRSRGKSLLGARKEALLKKSGWK